jgi:hypothetical protein
VELVRLGKLRWRIEQDYRELKGALGLDHFEGRSFPGWHHHVTWCRSRTASHPGAAALPKSAGVGLTLWQLLEQLQVLLACWAGACPTCRRPAPRWLSRQGRSRAPT